MSREIKYRGFTIVVNDGADQSVVTIEIDGQTLDLEPFGEGYSSSRLPYEPPRSVNEIVQRIVDESGDIETTTLNGES